MDSKQFLKEMLAAGEKAGDKPISRTIGKVRFQLGFSGFCAGHSMASLFRPFEEPGKADEIKAALDTHIKSLGGQGGAYLGVKYEVPADNVISFDAQYDKLHFVQAISEEADFNEILDAISNLNVPLNEWAWIAYKSIDSPTAVAKGEDGKFQPQDGSEPKYRKIIIPVEKFANEQAARAAAGGDSKSSATDNSQWSDTARKSYKGDITTLTALAGEVSEWYTKMIGGIAFANDPDSFPLPEPLVPPTVKKQLAEAYAVETADIDLLMSMDVAF